MGNLNVNRDGAHHSDWTSIKKTTFAHSLDRDDETPERHHHKGLLIRKLKQDWISKSLTTLAPR